MKKWLCSVFGHVYDPVKENIPAEIRGAAVCRYVDSHDDFAAHAATRKCKILTPNVFDHKSEGTPSVTKPVGYQEQRPGIDDHNIHQVRVV